MRESEARVREMLAESDIDAREAEPLVERLSELDRLVDETVREPGPELAALIAGLVTSAAVTPFRRRHARVLVAAAVAFGTVGVGGIAAAANELPPGAQRVVADFSLRYLPFTIPGPEAREDEVDLEVTDPTPSPAVSEEGQARPVEPAETPEASPMQRPQAPTQTPGTAPEKAPSPPPPPAPAPVEPEPAPTPSAPTDEATEGSAPVEGSDTSAGEEPEPTTSPAAEAAPTPSEPSSSPSPGDSEVNTRPWDGGESGEPSPSPSP